MDKELEEAAEEYAIWHDGNLPREVLIKNFIEGAKWMGERSYSEEEVLKLLNDITGVDPTWVEEWFEENKKK